MFSRKAAATGNAAPASNANDSSGSQRRAAPGQEEKLTDAEYEFIARDIMGKPPVTAYLKYHLPLRFAARCDEVKWEWVDNRTGRLVRRELIGGGRNSDLDEWGPIHG